MKLHADGSFSSPEFENVVHEHIRNQDLNAPALPAGFQVSAEGRRAAGKIVPVATSIYHGDERTAAEYVDKLRGVLETAGIIVNFGTDGDVLPQLIYIPSLHDKHTQVEVAGFVYQFQRLRSFMTAVHPDWLTRMERFPANLGPKVAAQGTDSNGNVWRKSSTWQAGEAIFPPAETYVVGGGDGSNATKPWFEIKIYAKIHSACWPGPNNVFQNADIPKAKHIEFGRHMIACNDGHFADFQAAIEKYEIEKAEAEKALGRDVEMEDPRVLPPPEVEPLSDAEQS